MIDYTPSTGLVVVDLQNDFADPAGSLAVAGGEQVVREANLHLDAAIAAGATIVFTQDWHPLETPHFAEFGGRWPVHCVQDTWGAELHPDLLVRRPSVHKGQGTGDGYSGFSEHDSRETVAADGAGEWPLPNRPQPTELADLLRAGGAVELVVLGLATDYCVRATALDARTLGWPVRLPLDAVRAVDLQPGDGDRAVTEMQAAGVQLA